ncbi:hypothetical protein [Halomonas sp. H2]|uniref:hypothetical protein n=1 Tax=Halomonas sp. H2 TaxID=261936 RepID=UPI003CEEF09E
MSKFKPGQTSTEVQKKKNDITKSILAKSRLMDLIKTIEDIPSSLGLKGTYISQEAAFKWSDEHLVNIVSFSRNTAYAPHNAHALKLLLKSIKKTNIRLSEKNSSDNLGNTNRHKDDTLSQLRRENEDLKNALAEVYRAYLQVTDRYREDRKVDESIRSLILEQAQILGKKRLWNVK